MEDWGKGDSNYEVIALSLMLRLFQMTVSFENEGFVTGAILTRSTKSMHAFPKDNGDEIP